ncbi:MAG TPA: BlaI/MecI/CopY family transcriptional regulator [Terriglobales bacterium]|nr:BlaI/MecI/CopY family transcriptional regulator [Terriglobales bacterium]
MDSLDCIFDNLLAAPLGPLERQIHQAVWKLGTATVREVIQDRKIWQTYSTILTTMDRLHRKGLLERVQEGKAFRYSARFSPEELERKTALRGMEHLLKSEDAPLHLSYFVEAVGAHDEKLLDQLQALVERQRAELRIKKGEEK